MKYVSSPWGRITRWLAANAPHTHASLLPSIAPESLRAALAPSGRAVPEEIVALYGLAGGQAPSAHESASGIFGGYWFMPLDGVDGLKQALEAWRMAQEAGADWATEDRFPFAKDFSGSYLCVERPPPPDDPDDPPDDARIVRVGDDDPEIVSESLFAYLYDIVTRLEDGELEMDRPVVEKEIHVVEFDACRVRAPGDRARHSVFDALGIEATAEDLDQLFGRFDKKPETVFGIAVRLVSSDLAYEDVEEVVLTDDRGHALRALAGKGCGGGKPGVLVYSWGKRPFPAGTRLRVKIAARVKR